MTVNRVTLIGNLGQDPEVRTTKSGTPVCTLRIATTERRKDAEGAWNDHTEWHSVVCFGRTADNVGRYLRKGRQVYVDGRLQTRKWTDRENRDRWSTEVVANDIRFLGGRDSAGGYSTGGSGGYDGSYGGGSQGGGGPGGAASGDASGGGGHGGPPDDDIPF